MLADLDVGPDAGKSAAEELFDREYYLGRYPNLQTPDFDPFEHFMTRGWRELRRPFAEFDMGWYLATHLDPACEAINPLVHYVLRGRSAGLATRPRFSDPKDVDPLAAEARRAVLFAGYDRDGLLDDTVLSYVTELSRHGDVFYLSDSEMLPGELAKLDGVAAGAWAVRHGAYDFGSYALLADVMVGWDRLASYDEVLLVNDSAYLLGALDEVFASMARRPCAWWGMQATEERASIAYGDTLERQILGWRAPVRVLAQPLRGLSLEAVARDMFERFPENEFHLGSYFVALRRPVIEDPLFRRFLSGARCGDATDKMDVVRRYEYILTRLLISRGHRFEALVDELYPYHPMYSEWAFEMLGRGVPLLKRALLSGNPYGLDLGRWQQSVLNAAPRANVTAIDAHLRRVTDPEALARSLGEVTA
jgi:hypothetical protein